MDSPFHHPTLLLSILINYFQNQLDMVIDVDMKGNNDDGGGGSLPSTSCPRTAHQAP
jgi:hypothetical protein